MDADKRHQLKQNELAEALSKLRDLNDPRFIYALVALVAIGLGVLAWYGWQYSRRHALEQGWQRLTMAVSALSTNDVNRLASAQDDLRSMIQDTKDPGLAGYARLELANSRIAQAFREPAERQAALQDAASLLEQIRGNPETPLTIQAAATFALASTDESLLKFDQAREMYKVLVDDSRFAAFAYKSLSEARLANLDKLSTPITFEPGAPPAPATQPQASATPIQINAGGPPGVVVQQAPALPVPVTGEPATSPPPPSAPPAEPQPAPAPTPTPAPAPAPAPQPGNNPTP